MCIGQGLLRPNLTLNKKPGIKPGFWVNGVREVDRLVSRVTSAQIDLSQRMRQ